MSYIFPLPKVRAQTNASLLESGQASAINEVWSQVCFRNSIALNVTASSVSKTVTVSGYRSDTGISPVAAERTGAAFNSLEVFEFIAILGTTGSGNETIEFTPEMQMTDNVDWPLEGGF